MRLNSIIIVTQMFSFVITCTQVYLCVFKETCSKLKIHQQQSVGMCSTNSCVVTGSQKFNCTANSKCCLWIYRVSKENSTRPGATGILGKRERQWERKTELAKLLLFNVFFTGEVTELYKLSHQQLCYRHQAVSIARGLIATYLVEEDKDSVMGEITIQCSGS